MDVFMWEIALGLKYDTYSLCAKLYIPTKMEVVFYLCPTFIFNESSSLYTFVRFILPTSNNGSCVPHMRHIHKKPHKIFF